MLTKRYLASTKNLSAILAKMVDGVAPDKFSIEHLQSIGFGSSNDRAVIPLLKDLGFLTAEGAPTLLYQAYRDRSQSKAVLAEALRAAYEDVFHIREIPTASDREAIEGVFRTKANSSDRVAREQTATFLALLKEADLNAVRPNHYRNVVASTPDVPQSETSENRVESVSVAPVRLNTELHYIIQFHLPATKDIEVFNAIFRSLRENLLT